MISNSVDLTLIKTGGQDTKPVAQDIGFELREITGQGRKECFVTHDICRNEIILEYVGERVSLEEWQKRKISYLEQGLTSKLRFWIRQCP